MKNRVLLLPLVFQLSMIAIQAQSNRLRAASADQAISPGSAPRTLYDEGGVSIIATETELTLELAVSEPDPILISVEVDRNQNQQFDRLVDVAYRPQRDGSLCPQYLIDSEHNTPCGGFVSVAHVKNFKDEDGRRQFVLELPKKEISFDHPSAKLALVIRNDAQRNTSFYPIERFKQTIDFPYAIKQLGGLQSEKRSDTIASASTFKPSPLSEHTSKQYTPPVEGFWSGPMKIGVTRTDADSNYHFVVNLTVPDTSIRPNMPSPYLINLITIYDNQIQNGHKVDVPGNTIPPVTGDWKAGDPVRLEFDLPKEYADPLQGWNLRFCIGNKAGCMPSSNLLQESEGAPKPSADAPHIRVQNRTNIDFKNVEVNGKQFGDIKAGASSGYQVMEHAYKYARVTLSTDSGPMSMLPTDYFGERQLRWGYYTYVLTVQEGRLQIECMVN